MTLLMPVCINCGIYSWKQAKTPSLVGPFYTKETSKEPLKRCGKCKVVYYCDKDCQMEHWEKVHKDKCKYLRREKGLRAGVHRHQEDMCQGCKEEKELVDLIKNKADPHWGCHMAHREQDFWSNPTFNYRSGDGWLYEAPLSVELGEFSGIYTSRLEQVVSILQKLLHKMKLTKHKLSAKEGFDELNMELFLVRHDYLIKAMYLPAGKLVHHNHSLQLMDSDAQKDILDIIRALGEGYQDSIEDEYRLWDTFNLIFDYFLDTLKDIKQDFEDIGKEVKDKHVMSLVKQVEPSVSVQEKWDKVVTALSSSLHPYKNLLEIILGDLQQECNNCKKEITIESTLVDHPVGFAKERRPTAICSGYILKYHCGEKKCREKVNQKHLLENKAMVELMLEEIQKLKTSRCDWCRTMKKEVHSCSRCLTKVYCSQECQDLDWEKVHKSVCRQDPDIRKLKSLQS